MFKGFYNLTSGMLSQGRRLDVVANNMTNISTSGYRAEKYTDSTFQEHVISRVGNMDKRGNTEIGPASYILAPSQIYYDYTQGAIESTGMPLDFAIEGDGFFAVQTQDGVAYTRNGSFSLDEEGYLCLPSQGRVLDDQGNELRLLTDRVQVDATGAVSTDYGAYMGRIGLYTFADNTQLTRNGQGLFTGNGAQPAEANIRQRSVERANVDLIGQMVEMMTAQRAIQSAAQLSKIYDQVMSKAANDVGRL